MTLPLGILSLLLVSINAWNYMQNGRDWDFAYCNDGTVQQAPIVIKLDDTKDFTPPFYFFPTIHDTTKVVYTDLGWTFRLSFSDEYVYTATPFKIFHGAMFELKHFEFHAPSEHKIGDIQYPLEMQLYGNFTEGTTSICKEIAISFLFENTGKNNTFLNQFLNKINKNGESFDITLKELLPIDAVTKHRFFSYRGTKTVPYCEPAVCWYVLTPALDISPTQLKEFDRRWKDNKKFANGNGNNRVTYTKKDFTNVFRYINT